MKKIAFLFLAIVFLLSACEPKGGDRVEGNQEYSVNELRLSGSSHGIPQIWGVE